MSLDGGLWFTLFCHNLGRGSPAFWIVVLTAGSQMTSPHVTRVVFQLRLPGGSLEGLRSPATLRSSSGLAGTAPSPRRYHDTLRAGLPGSCLAGCRLHVVQGKSEHILCLKTPVPSRAEAPRSTLKAADEAFVMSSCLSFQPHLGGTPLSQAFVLLHELSLLLGLYLPHAPSASLLEKL